MFFHTIYFIINIYYIFSTIYFVLLYRIRKYVQICKNHDMIENLRFTYKFITIMIIDGGQLTIESRTINVNKYIYYLLLLMNRMINTLVGDRFNRNYEIHIFNSHILSQLSYSATLKPRVYLTLDWASSRSHLFFRHHARVQLFSHTSLSFVFSSAMKYFKNSDHTTPLLYSYSRHTHSSIQTSCTFIHLW